MKRIYVLILSAALLLSLNASAQSFRSGYFLDNNVYGYRINPAQVNEKSFFGLAIGNLDLQNNANIGLASFLFPNGNSVVTGLNKAVSAEKFLGGLKEYNYLSMDESINILSLGISNGVGMHTVEINARVLNTESLPYDLFALLKKGGMGTFSMGGLSADLSVLSDISYGYSRRISDFISVGGRLHLLIGLAGLNLDTNSSAVTFSENKITVSPDISLNISGLPSIGSSDGTLDLSKFAFNGSPVGGIGATLDLGVQLNPLDGLEAMVSLTDLGAISWSNALAASVKNEFNYSGGTIHFADGTIDADFVNDLMNITSIFEPKVTTSSRTLSMMPFNIAAGARYHMPFYQGLSVGLLGTYHNAKYASWYDLRLGATITPAPIISASGNIGVGSFGPTWGAGLNAHLGPINLMLGADGSIGKMGKLNGITVPLNGFLLNVHAGIAIAFGKKK